MAEHILGGLSRFEIAGRHSTGAAIGQNSSLPSNDSTNDAFSIQMANNATVNASDIVVEEYLGGDKVKDTMVFGRSNVSQVDVIIDAEDPYLLSFLGGLNVDVTYNSLVTHWTDEIDALQAVQCVAMVSQRRKNRSTGVAGYRHLILPNVTGIGIKQNFVYQAKRSVTLRLVCGISTKNIGGDDIGDMNMGVADDELFSYYMDMPYQAHICTYIADGIETTFTPAYLPVSNVVTLAATYNQFFVNGAPTALTSFATDTGLATMAGAGSAADVNPLIYATDFVPAA